MSKKNQKAQTTQPTTDQAAAAPPAATEEPKAPQKFVLKKEIERLLKEGKNEEQIIDSLFEPLQKSSGRDAEWTVFRLRQELGFFRNYCQPWKDLYTTARTTIMKIVQADKDGDNEAMKKALVELNQ